ncbi:hypothetical protein VSH64_26930 [Amycolatopsis rhabdoformis]|uniref:Transmembrane protein n=1 Tax=Amycolatopsis rhabdoformis TaxID=1448059 RepID=A0ABZ1HXD6_9PSEU|nr:hypothetical protein [Amycolatopsis rhabdoformis]WSE26514.1 hypothetical protein VSH64_26930 [Amycolatopsis rhabdoformis]
MGFLSNPLVRRTDRVEGLLVGIAVVVSLVALPFVIMLAKADVSHETAASDAQLKTRHQVTATVVATAPKPASVGDSAPIAHSSRVTATWRLANGSPQTGVVTVPAGAGNPGSQAPIWLDSDGKQTTAPLTHADAVTNGVLVGTFTWLCAIGVLAGGFWIARRVLDRHRSARWAAEWAQFAGPEAVR